MQAHTAVLRFRLALSGWPLSSGPNSRPRVPTPSTPVDLL